MELIELISSYCLLFVLSLVPFMLVLGAHHLKTNKNKPKPNLPPGPRKFPLIGNLHLFAASHRHQPLQQTLRVLAKKYGPLMHLRLGEVDTIVVSSPETAKLFMKTHDINFASRPSLFLAEGHSQKSIALSPYGQHWRQMRKICSLELLTTKRVLSFRNIREEDAFDLCKWIALREGQKINLTERIGSANYDTMVRASIGKKIDEERSDQFIDTVRKITEFILAFRIIDVYPSLKLLPVISGDKRKIDNLHRRLDRVMTSIVEERKQRTSEYNIDDNQSKQEDLLDVLLRIQSDEESLDELPLTTENIKTLLTEMFGGATTSTVVMDWAMAEMLNNPETMKKAQDEVRRVFDDGGRVDESRFDELKYLRLVIKETLRLHPPGPLLIPRVCRERCEINGYEIPEKAWVLVNAWAIGRDPEYWEDAESFKPERFLEKRHVDVDFKGNSFEYIPFGAGRRICPGLLFAVANIEIQLAMLLYHFDWVLADGMKAREMDMSDHCGVEGKRKHNLGVIPVVMRRLSATK